MKKLPIIIALPVTDAKVESGALVNEIEQAASSTAQFVELRLDYTSDVAILDIAGIVRSVQDLGLGAICTCRIEAEGGGFLPQDREGHEMIVQRMISARPRYIDIELSTEPEVLDAVLDVCARCGVGTILSYHDFASTPGLDELDTFVQSINDKLAILPITTGNSIILKAIFTATSPADNIIPMKVIESFESSGFDVISFCMGFNGMISRITSVLPRLDGKSSGLLTYASLEQATAPGQLDLKSMEALLAPYF